MNAIPMENIEQLENLDNSDIAVIGLACRFPDAKDANSFWKNLREGKESIKSFSDKQLSAAGVSEDLLNNPNYVKAGTVLEDIEMFDAEFFGFNPREAEGLDPQHRLFLECVWEAIESSGYDTKNHEDIISVYAGTNISTYWINNLIKNPEALSLVGEYQSFLSNVRDSLTTRIAYKLNLRGACYSVQTFCSTSLVATQIACQSLLNFECDMAVAGGVSVSIPQHHGYMYFDGGILSPDGRCRAFDKKANGTVFGSGVGSVVLKRFDDAVANRDNILALIKGSATNNDGSSKVSFTAPSITGQAKVIAEALADACVDPDTISYIETHGTGTSIGDPTEIAALTKAFRSATDRKSFCAIGSVKPNIGHLDTAAGVAGLIKTILALQHKELPPSINFESPNPEIDFSSSPFYVNRELSNWDTHGIPLRAGVSSFGIGGTNAHVILEEAPTPKPSSVSRPFHLLVFSAKTQKALEAMTENLLNHFRQFPEINLADSAYTLQVGRAIFSHRRAIVCRDVDQAVAKLEKGNNNQVITTFVEQEDPPIVFLFPGEEAQYVNMGLELYKTEKLFRKQINHCSEILKSKFDLDLLPIIFPNDENYEDAAQKLKEPSIAQPALFVFEYALAQLWISWGTQPEAFVGHGTSEYVAACLSGVFTIDETLFLLVTRGRLMQNLSAEAILTVHANEQEIQPYLGPFSKAINKVRLQPPNIPILSNLTGTWLTQQEALDPSYWIKHFHQPVRFSDCLQELVKETHRVLLEVGPGDTLTTLARKDQDKCHFYLTLPSICHTEDSKTDLESILMTLGRLWSAGLKLNWTMFYDSEKRHRLPLPTYPFERQKYWIEPKKQEPKANGSQSDLIKNPETSDWFYAPSWERSVILPDSPHFKSQKAQGIIFLDESSFGSLIWEQLEAQQNWSMIAVKIGSKFQKKSENAYTINPVNENHYKKILKECLKQYGKIDNIIHLWNLSEKSPSQDSHFGIQDIGLFSLLNVAKTIGNLEITNQLKISVVTTNGQDVTGEEILNPEMATLLGPIKIIPLEYFNISCSCIDIVIPKSGTHQEKKLVQKLLAEFSLLSSEPIIAYRNKYRWLPVVKPIRLERSTTDPIPAKLKENGVYLITGGLGGIGFTVAEYLATTFKARLILVSRSEFPAKENWQDLRFSKANEDIGRKISKLEEFEKQGADIMIAQADVSNFEEIQKIIKNGKNRFGRIDGVLHAAGIADYGGMIHNRTSESIDKILAPKVSGTLILDHLLNETKLDFFILFSSIANYTYRTQFGQVAYAAANEFLDMFTHHKNSIGQNYISINWDGWEEVGMQVEAIKKQSSKKNSLSTNYPMAKLLGLTPLEGIEVLNRILMSNLSHVIISVVDLQARLTLLSNIDLNDPRKADKENNKSLRITDSHAPQGAAQIQRYSRPNLLNRMVAPRNSTEKDIVEIWKDFLGIEEIGIHDSFFELGGHSLLATQILFQLQNQFQIKLPIRSIFDSPTVAKLTSEVLTQLSTNQNKGKDELDRVIEREELEL